MLSGLYNAAIHKVKIGTCAPQPEPVEKSLYTLVSLTLLRKNEPMKRSLALACAILLPLYATPAFAAEVTELVVSREGDLEMGCGQLSQEALLMRDIITTTQDIKDDSEMKGYGVTAAGAVGSFLIGTVTGGVGLAAAGFLLEHNIEGEAEDADSVQDIAEQRRSLMMGVFNAKGCEGPIEHVLQDGLHREDRMIQIASMEPAAGREEPEDDPYNGEKPRYNE